MKNNFFSFLFFLALSVSFLAQGVGINNSGLSPNGSSMLDVESANKGLLIPRLALTSTTDITTITNGNVLSLLVFNTATIADVVPGYYYWNGAAWQTMGGSTSDDQNIDSLRLSGTTLTTYIEDGGSANVELLDLASNSSFFTVIRDSLVIDQENLDSLYGFINDSLLDDLAWLSELKDSIDSDVDSVILVNDALLEIYENGNVILADLTLLKDSSEWIDGSRVGLTPGAIYARKALANGNMVIIDVNGFLGVGTNNPRAFLDVGNLGTDTLKSVLARLPEGDASGKGTYLGVFSHNSQPSNVNSFSIQHRFYDTVNTSINFLRGGTHYDGEISFGTNRNIERMRIDVNGNVGIGLTSPNAKLDVNGDILYSGNASTLFKITSASDNIHLDMIKASTGSVNAQILFDGYGAPQDQGQIRFFTRWDPANGGTGVLNHAMSIIENGKVGIGTQNPATKLEIQGSVKIVDGTEGVGKVLMSDAAGKAHWENGVVKEESTGSYKRMCSGNTAPGAGWVNYSSVDGIYIDVNTSGCNFSSTPRYITSLGGGTDHWLKTGMTSIYSPTSTGFRIYLNGVENIDSNPDNPLRITDAEVSGYYINWIAIGE